MYYDINMFTKPKCVFCTIIMMIMVCDCQNKQII